MNEWLVHGNGAVRGVIIVCWAMDKEETVRGDVFLYTLDDQGIPVLRQSEVTMPLLYDLADHLANISSSAEYPSGYTIDQGYALRE